MATFPSRSHHSIGHGHRLRRVWSRLQPQPTWLRCISRSAASLGDCDHQPCLPTQREINNISHPWSLPNTYLPSPTTPAYIFPPRAPTSTTAQQAHLRPHHRRGARTKLTVLKLDHQLIIAIVLPCALAVMPASGLTQALVAPQAAAAAAEHPHCLDHLLERMAPLRVDAPASADRRLTRLLVNVTVDRSLWPVHVVLAADATVADLVRAAVAAYVREGRRPPIHHPRNAAGGAGDAADGFELHFSKYSLESTCTDTHLLIRLCCLFVHVLNGELS